MNGSETEPARAPVVFSAVDSLPSEQLAVLAEACREAGVELSSWQKRQPLPPAEAWPSLLVAGLPSGSRRVSDDLSQALNQAFPRVPLLLLCQEGLVRPTMTSHGGRVVLLGAPFSRSLVASRIRMLANPGRAFATRYWVGKSALGPSAPEPLIHEPQGGGLTAILPLSGQGPSPELAEQLNERLSGFDGAQGQCSAVSQLLGERYAAVHLARTADRWLVYAPSTRHALSLCSMQRLPRMYSLSLLSAKTPLQEVPAASGDLLVMSSAPPGVLAGEPPTELGDGGPGFLSFLEGAKFEPNRPLSSVVVELL